MVVIQVDVMLYTLFGLEPDNILNFLLPKVTGLSLPPQSRSSFEGTCSENKEEGDKEK